MGAMLAMSPYAISGFSRHAALNEIFILFAREVNARLGGEGKAAARRKAEERPVCQNGATMY
jgi:hypothetical protein